MKKLKFFIIALLILSLTGCTVQLKSTPEETQPEQGSVSYGSPGNEAKDTRDGQLKGFDWTINADDTISGKYQLPGGGKALDYNITLRLVAWKSGGEEVYGSYEGEAYILFEFDESGLSDADYLYMGGGTFNRRCEKLEFEVKVFDREAVNQKIIPLPDTDTISIMPLRNFNAMAYSDSVWSTMLHMDQTVQDRKSGDTLSQIEGGSGESSSDVMGIDLFIDNEHVTINIPTYRLTWECGYFTGTVVSSPLGTAKRDKLDMPDARLGYPDAGLENPNAGLVNPNSADGNPFESPDEDKWENPYEAFQNEFSDKYIQKDPNGLSGYDMNGDGKVDAYIGDDGLLNFDLNFDGVFDDLDNTEGAEYGQG